ncbi:hypothetical protein [Pyxidicoccus trucidator]|uniref:hypothetical protein n=1 Tax=Pyxidicoccus trucidator TaxID=2709662 RepID=UPI001F07569B|nr:hypothetical protein [Pyxidicoccus trucidator]
MLSVLLLVALTSLPVEEGPLARERPYPEVLAELTARREELATRWRVRGVDRAAVRSEARTVVLQALTGQVLPAWHGTPWEFYGTTRTPRSGGIACGYLVSTVLEDAGFRVERVRMAQQPAEHIVKTLAPPRRTWRFRNRPVSEVVHRVTREGEGLYVVGLDYHVGFLWNDGSRVWMCHSSYLGTAEALCEDALTSPAMLSRYHVVGRLLEDGMLDAWLEGRALPTVTR